MGVPVLITAADTTAWTGEVYSGTELDRVNAAIAAFIEIFLLIRGVTVTTPAPPALVAIARLEVPRALNSEPGVSNERVGDLASGHAYGGAAYDLSPGAERALRRYARSIRKGVNTIRLVRPENWDVIAPTTSTGLSVTDVASTSISLSWAASTDARSVVGYRIYEGTTLVADVCETSATIYGLPPSTSHNYQVSAYDAGLEKGQELPAAFPWPDPVEDLPGSQIEAADHVHDTVVAAVGHAQASW
jgi:hypothetical protein